MLFSTTLADASSMASTAAVAAATRIERWTFIGVPLRSGVEPSGWYDPPTVGPREPPSVKYILMIYNDNTLLDALPPGELDSRLRGCIAHADDLRRDGKL